MTNYWPVLFGSLIDCVGGASATAVSNSFGTDRAALGSHTNDAVYLNSGYAQFPSGVYFNSAYSITSWVKAGTSLGSWCRVIDFSQGGTTNEIYLALQSGSSGKLGFGMYNSPEGSRNLFSSVAAAALSTSSWSFVAITYDGFTISMYVNGASIDSTTYSSYWIPNSVTRTSNYLGLSNSPDGVSNSYIDQLAFYNRALTASQISSIYSISYGTAGAN